MEKGTSKGAHEQTLGQEKGLSKALRYTRPTPEAKAARKERYGRLWTSLEWRGKLRKGGDLAKLKNREETRESGGVEKRSDFPSIKDLETNFAKRERQGGGLRSEEEVESQIGGSTREERDSRAMGMFLPKFQKVGLERGG